jgi:hypothetical protein
MRGYGTFTGWIRRIAGDTRVRRTAGWTAVVRAETEAECLEEERRAAPWRDFATCERVVLRGRERPPTALGRRVARAS